jgi:hypothetical protein
MYKDEIVQMMAADSFSVMAYETAPRCLAEIERLKRLLRTTSEQKTTVQHATIDRRSFSIVGGHV